MKLVSTATTNPVLATPSSEVEAQLRTWERSNLATLDFTSSQATGSGRSIDAHCSYAFQPVGTSLDDAIVAAGQAAGSAGVFAVMQALDGVHYLTPLTDAVSHAAVQIAPGEQLSLRAPVTDLRAIVTADQVVRPSA